MEGQVCIEGFEILEILRMRDAARWPAAEKGQGAGLWTLLGILGWAIPVANIIILLSAIYHLSQDGNYF